MKLKTLSPNAYYDMAFGEPKILEHDNDGTHIYRYNVKPCIQQEEGKKEPQQVGWQCREIRLHLPPTCENLKNAIINSVYDAEQRFDLLNRHNAYMAAISNDPTIAEKYKDFMEFCQEVDVLLGCETVKVEKMQVPRFVTNRQFRLMLISKGVDLQMITNEINKLPNPYKQQALISWEYAPTFERSNPMIAQLAEKLGFNENILDQIFIEADKL